MIKAFVVYGLGIGCHNEVAHAYEKAGASSELVHMNYLLSGDLDISKSKIVDFAGGFLQGDILGSGMCAANEIEHALCSDDGMRLKDKLAEFAQKGNIIYGQCNGFQVLVKTGL